MTSKTYSFKEKSVTGWDKIVWASDLGIYARATKQRGIITMTVLILTMPVRLIIASIIVDYLNP